VTLCTSEAALRPCSLDPSECVGFCCTSDGCAGLVHEGQRCANGRGSTLSDYEFASGTLREAFVNAREIAIGTGRTSREFCEFSIELLSVLAVLELETLRGSALGSSPIATGRGVGGGGTGSWGGGWRPIQLDEWKGRGRGVRRFAARGRPAVQLDQCGRRRSSTGVAGRFGGCGSTRGCGTSVVAVFALVMFVMVGF